MNIRGWARKTEGIIMRKWYAYNWDYRGTAICNNDKY
jgi:hypothetical protein